ncbi:hypothetical protein [Calothrix sp. PCC 6303]|uniref:hypothetical protein n=1 Tax=Calothrix sp. PCC 6303 TaxID=1170562 RepID=UPI0002A01789|nr:hypothetical protein [Calothrix sp. PCC 6303]AFY99529.1 hypothetical protein Cal6303_0452 [Calothrix sp. PCC 6303]
MSFIPELLAIRTLTRIAEDPQIIGRILEELGEMPNISMPTMGGHIFWTEIANVNGWRLQRNKVFGNCRILDPNDVRRAWGGENAMLKAFETL